MLFSVLYEGMDVFEFDLVSIHPSCMVL